MQYTVRKVPKQIDRVFRARAKAEGRSLNEAIIDAIKAWAGVPDDARKKRDLSDLVGSLSKEDAKAIEETVVCMDEADLKFQREAGR